MGNIKICHRNYANEELLNAYSSSSANAQAPMRNLFPDRRRSQTWRSAGYFVVTASNKTIVFEETASVPLTATIAEGSYATSALFFAAVKAALEAPGVATYTVDRDPTTQRIQITSNLGGGATVFRLLWTNVSSTAQDILGYDDSTDDTGSSSYLADEAVIHTEEWLKFDLGAVSNPKGFIICGLRNKALGISSVATVKLQANNSDSWTSPPVDITLTWDDRTMFYFDEAGIGGYRYWRLYISDPTNANGYVEISKIFLGDVIEPVQGAVQFPMTTSLVDFATPVESMMGTKFSNQRQKTQDMRFSWQGLSAAEAEELKDFWEDVGTSIPFFLHVDPRGAMSTQQSRWCLLAQFQSNPDIVINTVRVWGGDWDLREVV